LSSIRVSILQAGYCACPEHIAIRGGKWSNIHFPAMFALLEHPHLGPMLFDTGYSFAFFRETRSFPNRFYRMLTPVTLNEEQLAVNQLQARGIRPRDITRIFISHFHADHTAALGDFPNASFIYFPSAYAAVAQKSGIAALAHAFIPGLIPANFSERSNPIHPSLAYRLPAEYAPFEQGYDLLGDESMIAVELPGHAWGQMGLFVRAETDEIYFFVADAAWLYRSIAFDRPPHPFANLIFSEPRNYLHTLHQLHLFRQNRPDVHIIPSHCADTLAAHPAAVGPE
jgi:glyoxylase-like metal-dependent hydrolase (beta-lactamase superfamily II)